MSIQSPGAMVMRTPYYHAHLDLGATFYMKERWMRPAEYGSVVDEHLACRTRAGLFDVHSLGKIEVKGPGARQLLDSTATNDVGRLTPGRGLYTCFCDGSGGILDDSIVYCRGDDDFYVVVGTPSRERILQWLRRFATDRRVAVVDVTSSTAYLALQGPESRSILEDLLPTEDLGAEALPYFGCRWVDLDGIPCFLARTGYTGELGFELNFPAEFALSMWEQLLTGGQSRGLRPCGGFSLQSLRIEKAYRNYGNDISVDTNPVEAGLAWLVKPDGRDFVGREAYLRAQERPLARKLLNLQLEADRPPNVGDGVVCDGRRVGSVTSAAFGPSVGGPVALAYVDAPFFEQGAPLQVQSAWGDAKAAVCPGAFYDPSGSRLRS